MVLPGDQVKVADFGIARLEASEFTIVGDLLGTPAYMAPEQLSGGPIDHRTDLFATGVILFEMLTGVKPFRGKSITEIMIFMEKRGPEDIRALNPAVPEAMKHVIGKSVAFDPAQRYADAAAFSRRCCRRDARPAGEAAAPRLGNIRSPGATHRQCGANHLGRGVFQRRIAAGNRARSGDFHRPDGVDRREAGSRTRERSAGIV